MSDTKSPVDQIKELVLTQYPNMSASEKEQIQNAGSAAAVAVLVNTFVEDIYDPEYGYSPGLKDNYDPGVSDTVATQITTIVNSEQVTSENATAHAAFQISETDRNTSNGVEFKPSNYIKYLNAGTVDEVIELRNIAVPGDAAKDDDNVKLMTDISKLADAPSPSVAATTAPGYAEAYGEYAAGMSEQYKKQAAEAAKKMISDEQTLGKDIDGDGKVGYVKLADFEKKDVKGAFDKKQAELQAAIQQDGPDSSALAQYNQSVKDEANVKKAVVAVETKIEENKAPGAWAGVPSSIAKAEQADTNSQLQQEKAKVQEFGVAVAGMTPAERENLDKFFAMAKEDPEGTKKFVQSAQAKDKHVEMIQTQIEENKAPGAWAGVPSSIAKAEQADMNAQLNAEKAAVVAAPLDLNTRPELVSDLNPTGDIQKDKDLKAFFAQAKAAEEEKVRAASSVDVRISQINAYGVPQSVKNKAIAEVKKGNTASVSDLVKFFSPPAGGSGSNGNGDALIPPITNPNKIVQKPVIAGKPNYQ